MELTTVLVVLGYAIGTIGLGWVYFRRWPATRPPIGVFNLVDVLFLLGGIVVLPLLYLTLPLWSVAGLLALGALSALYFALEPILGSRAPRALLVILAAAGEAAALVHSGPTTAGYFLVNNAVLVVGTIGVANLWAQSGLKARDAAILGAVLAAYDVVATSLLSVMSELFAQASRLPFAPLVGWTAGRDGWMAIGLGDLLVATVFPLVMRKAYGRAAGWAALAIGSALIAAVFALGALGGLRIFLLMAVLGPAMVLQYAGWTRHRGQERTTRQYLEAEPWHGDHQHDLPREAHDRRVGDMPRRRAETPPRP